MPSHRCLIAPMGLSCPSQKHFDIKISRQTSVSGRVEIGRLELESRERSGWWISRLGIARLHFVDFVHFDNGRIAVVKYSQAHNDYDNSPKNGAAAARSLGNICHLQPNTPRCLDCYVNIYSTHPLKIYLLYSNSNPALLIDKTIVARDAPKNTL